jgi:arylsulfatase A-like enzyme
MQVGLSARWPVARDDLRPWMPASGSVCHEPVITTDFYPTMLQMAGTTGDANHNTRVDGGSIVPLLKDPAAKLRRDALYWHYPHYHPGGATPHGTVRAGDWRLVEFYADNHVELYNLKEDVGEKHDLAAQMPAKAAELRQQLHDRRQAVGAQMPTPNPNYQPEGTSAKPAMPLCRPSAPS